MKHLFALPAVLYPLIALAAGGISLRFETDAPQQQVRCKSDSGAQVMPEMITLKNTSTGDTIEDDKIVLSADENTGDQYIRFPGYVNGVLPDGVYQLMVGSSQFEFFVLSGDINRDRKVDTLDFNILSGNFGVVAATYSNGDLNYDGTVDSKDLNILQGQVGKSLPAPATQPATQPGQ